MRAEGEDATHIEALKKERVAMSSGREFRIMSDNLLVSLSGLWSSPRSHGFDRPHHPWNRGVASLRGRQHGGDGGGGGEDAGGGFAHLRRGECLIDGGEAAVFVGGMAEEQVERDVAGDVGGGLLLDGEAAEHGGADAVERVVRDAGGGDFGDFGEQFAAGESACSGAVAR